VLSGVVGPRSAALDNQPSARCDEWTRPSLGSAVTQLYSRGALALSASSTHSEQRLTRTRNDPSTTSRGSPTSFAPPGLKPHGPSNRRTNTPMPLPGQLLQDRIGKLRIHQPDRPPHDFSNAVRSRQAFQARYRNIAGLVRNPAVCSTSTTYAGGFPPAIR